MRIGFLFNHDALHQISHTAPVIVELVRFPAVETVVLTSTPEQEAQVRALIGDAAARVTFVPLRIGRVAETLDHALRFVAPFRRIATLRANLDIFRALDVLVVPETTSLLLRDRFGLRNLKFVWIPHGAGDRAIGFRPVVRGFDLVLLSGEKVRDRMLAGGLVTPATSSIVGYPKFDALATTASPPRLFANDRPTVLYNPHFDPRLSSWYTMAPAILDWFARQSRFNLVVAPHVMLFNRRIHASVEHRIVRWRRDIPSRYKALPHMIVDPGSSRSIDMTYTRAADIYLGDASSQIYEWIANPRPAIFLNPGHRAWANDPEFAHWRLGQVIDRVTDLPAALDRAVADPDAYRPAQIAAFDATFSRTGEPAPRRAARAIVEHFMP